MRFNTPIRATRRDMLKAAYHEVGHAMMAQSMGLHVYAVIIRRDGSGYCDVDIPASPIRNLRITIAGYVAERVLGGYHPSYAGMRRDRSQSDDVEDVEAVLQDGRVKPEVAVPAAFEYTTKFFQEPANKARLRRIAKRLTRTRVLLSRTFA